MTDTRVDRLFNKLKAEFLEWLKKKPTGQYYVNIEVNEGGIRRKPETGTKQKVDF